MNDTVHQNINIPAKPGVTFSLRQPEVENPKHATLLGKTFATILTTDANEDFVKSLFDELSKHYIRKTFNEMNVQEVVAYLDDDD